MADLKTKLAEMGFENPVSYINSGNLFFDSKVPEKQIKALLTTHFNDTYDFPLPFALIRSDILQKEADKLSDWWQDETAYRRDALFYLPDPSPRRPPRGSAPPWTSSTTSPTPWPAAWPAAAPTP